VCVFWGAGGGGLCCRSSSTGRPGVGPMLVSPLGLPLPQRPPSPLRNPLYPQRLPLRAHLPRGSRPGHQLCGLRRLCAPAGRRQAGAAAGAGHRGGGVGGGSRGCLRCWACCCSQAAAVLQRGLPPTRTGVLTGTAYLPAPVPPPSPCLRCPPSSSTATARRSAATWAAAGATSSARS
jgi:hypothetical protein